jgi:hypothetical protein
MSTIAKIISAILAVLAVAALAFLIGSWMSNISHNETTHPNTQQVCQIPERTTIDGFRFNPIKCIWEEAQNTPAQEATGTPTPMTTAVPPTPAPDVQPTPAASQPASQSAPAVTDPTPKNAVILHNGDTVIPNWGYGPWGVVGVDYVDVFPNQQATMGPVEFKTDFNGRNWVPSGCWTWQLPSGWKEIRISVQGDTPVQVTVQNNELTACSNAKITMKAQPSIDGTPKPSAGSSGFSIVTYIE